MDISALSETARWLSQFELGRDRNLASQLLDKIHFVKTSEVETFFYNHLKEISENKKRKIAVYPISSVSRLHSIDYNPFGLKLDWSDINTKIIKKRKYGSEDSFGHLISQFTESIGVISSPTLIQLKSEKIDTIVLIDDIIGSGNRLFEYWKYIVPKSIKSLLSYKRVELYLLIYTSNDVGMKFVKKKLHNLPSENIIINIKQEAARDSIDPSITDLCKRYASTHLGERKALGYRNTFNRVIFEHGIPNNTPSVLHVHFKKWKPIFSGRRISPEIKSLIRNSEVEHQAETLWSSRERQLAVAMLSAFDAKAKLPPEGWNMIAWLVLFHKGLNDPLIAQKLLLSDQKISELRSVATSIGLINGGGVSSLGTAYLGKFKKRYRTRDSPICTLGVNEESYYPIQCGGRERGFGKTAAVEATVRAEV